MEKNIERLIVFDLFGELKNIVDFQKFMQFYVQIKQLV